jgi:bacillithiol biosynthesis cysteine-adding enzyme BshC
MLVKKDLPLHKKQLNALVYDYVSKKSELSDLYSFFPDKDGFSKAIASNEFKCDRTLLKTELLSQAKMVSNTRQASLANIELLSNEKTFTITTGHQLCLFTGPLYFIYKIFSVINLCEKLKQEFPQNNFVPVYWMASEDHDFAEVNHLHVFGKKVMWESAQTGAVGHFSTSELESIAKQLEEIWGSNENAKALVQLFKDSYLRNKNLADATRYLVNELFGEYGLVIVDGNSKALKRSFKEFFRKDIFENTSYRSVNSTIETFKEQNYEAQVNPREINCFYMEGEIRARIDKEQDKFRIVGTDKLFSKQEIESIIETKTDLISPNVVSRPAYQQFILPNLAYVGGPGELAYWLEYKTMFDALKLAMPVLVPRKMVTLIESASQQRMEKLGLGFEDFYEEEQALIKLYLERSNSGIDLENYKKEIEAIYTKINSEAAKVDKTLGGAVDSEKQKTLNSISAIEAKMNKAVKQRSETEVNQIKGIKSKLFPNNLPQEREDNFSMYYVKWGKDLIKFLKENLNYDLKNQEQIVITEKS